MEFKTFLSYGYVRALIVIALIGLVLSFGAYAHLTFKQAKYIYSGPTVISVYGIGEVLARPDVGQFSFSVRAEGETATEAQKVSAESINKIMEYLTRENIAESDIKTSYYNLNPRYRFENRICPAGSFCPPGEQVMDGFEVSQTIEVKVRDLESAGELISGVGERGATNISGLSFTIDDPEILKAEAREKAIENAKEKIEKLAEDLGVTVVRMNGFWEDEGGHFPIYDGYGGDMEVESRAMNAPSVPTGENTITSRVNVSYEVR